MDDKVLHDLVKELKLEGMIETLDSRLKEARNKSLAYEELLGLLLQDEVQIRSSKALANKLKQARFDEVKTFEGLDTNRYTAEIRQIMNHLQTGQYLREKQNIIILGPTGTGKTHLAQALGHQACRHAKKVKFVRANNLFSEFNASRADDTWQVVLSRYSKTDVLIIDDFGLKGLTHTQASDLYELIAEKHVKSSFIITSNRKTEHWLELFPDPVMANAALDRVVHNSFCIVLDGESYRKNFIPKIKKEEVAEKK
jgi:DNA replication protein DnaC